MSVKHFLVSCILLACYEHSYSQQSILDCTIRLLDSTKEIRMGDFLGKNILITSSRAVVASSGELNELTELASIYSNSLVVIVIPCLEFKSGADAKKSRDTTYSKKAMRNLFISNPVISKGTSIHSIWLWLASKSSNSVLDANVTAPHQKFLINPNGQLIGVFSDKVSPLSQLLQEALVSKSR